VSSLAGAYTEIGARGRESNRTNTTVLSPVRQWAATSGRTGRRENGSWPAREAERSQESIGRLSLPGIRARRDVSEAAGHGGLTARGHRVPRPRRRTRASTSGVTMAEFALLAPVAFLLLTSIVVVGIMITNYIQVTNVAREGARIAAICAGESKGSVIPDGSTPARPCTVTGVENYMADHLTSVPGGSVNPSVEVCAAGSCNPLLAGDDLAQRCTSSTLIEVNMSYPQPLYLPLVSTFFQDNSNGTRSLTARAEAGCE